MDNLIEKIAQLEAENERLKSELSAQVQCTVSELTKRQGAEARFQALCEAEPVAWKLTRQRDGFIRGCYTEKPTHERLQIAVLEGEQYTALIPRPSIEKKS